MGDCRILDCCYKPIPPLIVLLLTALMYSVLFTHHIHPMALQHQADVSKQIHLSTPLPDLLGIANSIPLPHFKILWPLVVFHFCIVLFLMNFIRCCLTSPGKVELKGFWDFNSDEAQFNLRPEEVQLISQISDLRFKTQNKHIFQRIRALPFVETKNTNGALRSCKKCNVYKPDRSHHCWRCKRCIMKMDHHCPWIMNCVGFHNQKFFLLLLVYGALSLIFYASIMFERMTLSFHNVIDFYEFLRADGLVLVSWVAAFFMGCALTLFTMFHFYLVLAGMTTIELREKQNHDDEFIRHKWEMARIKFNQGVYGNFMDVFGSKWYYWLLPVASDYNDRVEKTGKEADALQRQWVRRDGTFFHVVRFDGDTSRSAET